MQKAPILKMTDPNDLHAQIQAMIAAAQGGPLPMQAPPDALMPPSAAPATGAPAPAMPQAGGSSQNIQKAMLAKAIRGS